MHRLLPPLALEHNTHAHKDTHTHTHTHTHAYVLSHTTHIVNINEVSSTGYDKDVMRVAVVNQHSLRLSQNHSPPPSMSDINYVATTVNVDEIIELFHMLEYAGEINISTIDTAKGWGGV